jgi:hypothetical protein
MNVEQAKQRLLALLDERGGSLQAADVEADAELSRNQDVVSAVAYELATESDIYPGKETGERKWFPFSFLMRGSSPEVEPPHDESGPPSASS